MQKRKVKKVNNNARTLKLLTNFRFGQNSILLKDTKNERVGEREKESCLGGSGSGEKRANFFF